MTCAMAIFCNSEARSCKAVVKERLISPISALISTNSLPFLLASASIIRIKYRSSNEPSILRTDSSVKFPDEYAIAWSVSDSASRIEPRADLAIILKAPSWI